MDLHLSQQIPVNYSDETDQELPETGALALKFVIVAHLQAPNKPWTNGWLADEFSTNPISDMLQLVMIIS